MRLLLCACSLTLTSCAGTPTVPFSYEDGVTTGYRGNAKSWRNNAWFTYLWKNDPQFVVNFHNRWRILDELAIYKPVIAAKINWEMAVWNRCQTPEY